LTLNILETTQDRATVSIEHQKEGVCALSNGNICNDRNTYPNPVFKVTAFLELNISKMVS